MVVVEKAGSNSNRPPCCDCGLSLCRQRTGRTHPRPWGLEFEGNGGEWEHGVRVGTFPLHPPFPFSHPGSRSAGRPLLRITADRLVAWCLLAGQGALCGLVGWVCLDEVAASSSSSFAHAGAWGGKNQPEEKMPGAGALSGQRRAQRGGGGLELWSGGRRDGSSRCAFSGCGVGRSCGWLPLLRRAGRAGGGAGRRPGRRAGGRVR